MNLILFNENYLVFKYFESAFCHTWKATSEVWSKICLKLTVFVKYLTSFCLFRYLFGNLSAHSAHSAGAVEYTNWISAEG